MELTRRGAVWLAGAASPAAGTAGHSFAGRGDYTVDDDLDFLAGQSGWLFCNRCAGPFYGGSNTAGVCSGLGEVQAENHFSQAQCSTSPDGVCFARSVLV